MGANQSDNATTSNGTISSTDKADLVAKIRKRVENATEDEKQLARKLGGVFLFNIIKGQSVYCWTMNLNEVQVFEGEPEEDPDATFTLTEYNFRQLALGKEDPRLVLAAGRCSVTGDIMRAMKLEPYINLDKPFTKTN